MSDSGFIIVLLFGVLFFGVFFGALAMLFLETAMGNTEYGTLHQISIDLKYCPHPDYYYNDHIKDCDHFGITPTHPTLNLTGY